MNAYLVFAFDALANDQEYLELVLAQAEAKNVSQDTQWKRLLHIEQSNFHLSPYSLIDEKEFFLAGDFARDPKKELNATLRAFFLPASDNLQHPQCKYPARYYYLKNRLNFDSNRLNEVQCLEFQEWREALNPAGITLIFPTAYLNNPASMFGHTLFRIDANNQEDTTSLLAYGASYAAGTNETSGFIFAIKGIFGGYLGAFNIAPYYKIVKEYSDLENRDVWEYQLDLSKTEIELIIRHIWEMKNTFFFYYFFDENCSYHLLSLIDLARPELNLTQQFKYWAIPLDTVKAVVAEKRLVKKVVYRPSKTTILKQKLVLMTEQERSFAKRLVSDSGFINEQSFLALDEELKVKLLEFAVEYVAYQRALIKEERSREIWEKNELILLKERSKLKTPSYKEVYANSGPENSHYSRMLSVSFGLDGLTAQDSKKLFSEIIFKPAYHDILAPQQGYVDGSALTFFELRLRKYEEENIKLEAFYPLSIMSLSPRDDFFKKYSWNLSFGGKREKIDSSGNRKFVSAMKIGSGLSYKLAQGILNYNFLNTNLAFDKELDDDYRLGLSYQAGLIIDYNSHLRGVLNLERADYFLGEKYHNFIFTYEQRLLIDLQNTLNLSFSRKKEFDFYENEVLLSVRKYF